MRKELVMKEATQDDYSTFPTLYLAFELSNTKWRLGFTVGLGQNPRERTIAAGDVGALEWEIGRAKERFHLGEETRVLSCYEAGRDGFWLHRYLEQAGHENLVVDSASIEVSRRKRRAKTDGMDVGKLLRMLIRYDNRERKVWSVVRVPSKRAEDQRHLHRELMSLKTERTRYVNRIKGLLVGQGVRMPVKGDFVERLEGVRLWDGRALPEGLRARLEYEFSRYEFTQQQIKELEGRRRALIREGEGESIEKVRQLMRLRGIGVNSAWLLVMEFFGWRQFRNRRQVGSLAGLTPTPHQSGEEGRELGISKAGNVPIRTMMIEIAWGWLRFQPESELSWWYQERFGRGSKRVRKIGIVALARKLLIALWRYVEYGEVPAGAELKA
jgi:transposase